MSTDILVPPLSQTMDSLTLVAWLKKVGDRVEKGDPLFQVETDKATLDVEAPASGILTEVLAEVGSEVLIKSRIGVIGEITATATGNATVIHGNMLPAESTSLSLSQDQQPQLAPVRIFASPRARNLAKTQDVPLSEVKATGPQSMIVERDVLAYLEARKTTTMTPDVEIRATPVAKRVAAAEGVDLRSMAQAHPGEVIRRADVDAAIAESQRSTAVPVITPASLSRKGRPIALTTLRKTIARRMQESHQTTAPVTITREVDATELVNLRANILKEIAEADPRPTYTDFLLFILGRVLPSHPNINALFNGEMLETYEILHINLAMDTERGLLAPVIHDVSEKGLLELAAERVGLAEKAMSGTLTQDELSSGTFTLTNLGPLGVDGFTPIINPPQVAILGIGRIRPIPAVFEEQVAIRQMMVLSLTFDHRVVDGAPAARFLQDVTQLIEKPYRIWL
jgi:pyruvate dehydrogenase E2 component (dihydrolipoamide acetyltransferase)